MSKNTLLVLLITFLNFYILNAQKSTLKKADEEFDTFAYIDAREIYLNIVKEGYDSPQVYKKLGDTYYFNSEYTEAVKWYEWLIRKYPNNIESIYYYRVAQSLKSIGEYQKSKKMMGEFASKSANSVIAQNFMANYPSLDSLIDFESEKFDVVNATKLLSSSDFGPSFYMDKIVYASSSSNTKGNKIHQWNGLPYLDLYEAEIRKDGELANPEPLKGEINTPFHESSAAFTKDGGTIYFTRNNYINGKKKRNKEKLMSLKIYKAVKKKNGSWGDVEELPFNSDSYSVAHPALSPDEKKLYFSSDMPGTHGQSDIWYVDVLNHMLYGDPVNLGPEINTEARETFPFISKNNNLYFASDGHLGLGGLDIFAISLNKNGEFEEVTNLKKPINSNKDDFGFIFKEDTQLGYLSSNRGGIKGSSSDDIYKVVQSCGKINIQGIISDASTGKPLENSRVVLMDRNSVVLNTVSTDAGGNYNFNAPIDCDKEYIVKAEYKDYLPNERSVTTPRGTAVLQIDLELIPPDCPIDDLGCRLNLQPIYFDYGKHFIRADAEVELAKILEAMKQYPELTIHIESHTDSRSSADFNLRLSEKRATATLEWLVAKGISRNRLSAKGYGETQLLNECSNGVRCSDNQHQLNRRSMFIIQN
ncbi:OmpA family protein [Flagellimonas nanhaiensis]|uniref:Flagellar motor protein MotB n=1 Tax=Flagellimonas nanhaiensis TaxID=2292706 RepID=A0A371JV57_9FLAO|nr:OmpA family protein [Allomuricauda nanhaiensis]RDY61701.1 flagellar motor protein MotB [Allomuricauda nanhaiensis]